MEKIYLLQLQVRLGDQNMPGLFDTISAHRTREAAEAARARVQEMPAFQGRRVTVSECPLYP